MTEMSDSVASQLPLSPQTARTARRAAVKAHLARLGLTVTKWSNNHGYHRKTVYKVLSGELHGHFGVTHNIAVRLGIKDGEIDPAHEPMGAPDV